MSCKRIKASAVGRDFSNLGPWQAFKPLDDQKPLVPSKLIGKFPSYHEFLIKNKKYKFN